MADHRPRLAKWIAAASDGNRFSLVAQEQVMAYMRTVPRLDSIGNTLDLPLASGIGPVACKPFMVLLGQVLGLPIKAYRVFAPRHLFVFWQIDPTTSLILTTHFECEQAFTLSNNPTMPANEPPLGKFIPVPALDDPVSNLRLTGHKGSLREELVNYRGYFFAPREEVLFDLGDGSLPVTIRV